MNSKSIINGFNPVLEHNYVTSNYIEGDLTGNILAKDYSANCSSLDRYHHYYSFTFLRDFGLDTLRSPHSGEKLKINKHILDILNYFKTPKSLNKYIQEKKADHSVQERLLTLIKYKFLFPEEINQDRCFYLTFVEIDTNTICNHACTYCPVAFKPRQKEEIKEELFDDILSQISLLDTRNEISIYLSAYNEITLDKRYPRFVRKIKERGFNHTPFSNGSNLTPSLVDELSDLGIRKAVLNIPAVDEKEFYRLTGRKNIQKIINNVNYASKKLGYIQIIVHGLGDWIHYKNFTDVKRKFPYPAVSVNMGKTNDRAGNLKNEFNCTIGRDELNGCVNSGSRLINWIHVNARGESFLCCMDYDNSYKIGDLNSETVTDILSGESMALYRRYAYGLETAPADFICRKCMAALFTSWKGVSERDMRFSSFRPIQYYLKYKYASASFHLPLNFQSRYYK